MNALKQWLNSLAPRERRIVLAGAAVLAAALAYLLVWEPLQVSLSDQRDRLERQRAELAELTRIRDQVEKLRQQAESRDTGSVTAPLSAANNVAQSMGLGGALQRVEPRGENRVQVWFEGAAFADLVRWLRTMQSEHRLTVANATIERHEEPGSVTAQLTLER